MTSNGALAHLGRNIKAWRVSTLRACSLLRSARHVSQRLYREAESRRGDAAVSETHGVRPLCCTVSTFTMRLSWRTNGGRPVLDYSAACNGNFQALMLLRSFEP